MIFFDKRTLEDFITGYKNTAENNDAVHEAFTGLLENVPWLKEHRDYIEKNQLGFGDRAFHYMWLLVVHQMVADGLPLKALEIGVYKGQVISLWALIASRTGISLDISAVSPLEGKQPPYEGILLRLTLLFNRKLKEEFKSGNMYEMVDYKQIIKVLFQQFSLDFGKLKLLKGFSADPVILEQLREEQFGLIYIDGDHSFEGVIRDLENFTPKLVNGGYLIMDDASCNLPGTVFWKGRQSVSDAVTVLDKMGFLNVLNVGHNRIYKKVIISEV